MRILVISNLFPPAFLGGYEIGAAWVCEELNRLGHQVMIWTGNCAVDGRQTGYRLLPQPRNDQYQWLPSGPTIYGIDVLGGLLMSGYDQTYDPVRQLLHDFIRSYPELREQRRRIIEEFAPEQVLIFNPACILDPVFAEIACLPSLASVPRVVLISDDWPLNWQSNHPLVFLWREWHSAKLRASGHPNEHDGLLADLGDWISSSGIFGFSVSPDYTHACFTSAHLRDKCRPAILHGVPNYVVHWGLPGVSTYPLHQPSKDITRPLRLVFCGQVQPHKGLIRVLQALQFTQRACSLLVVGDDTTDYGRFCNAYVTEKGLNGRVEFTGKLSADQVAPLLAKHSDVLLLPSLAGGENGFEEPFSIVLLQGMAMGLAVVASRSGGSVEAFIEHESGCFIDPDQPFELARLVDELDADRQLSHRLGQAARLRVETKFTIETMVQRLLEIAATPGGKSPCLLYAVRNATIDPANSGCVRVTRRLGRLLERKTPVTFATWTGSNGFLRQLRGDQAEVLNRFNGPRQGLGIFPEEKVFSDPVLKARNADGWLLLPEIMAADEGLAILAQAKQDGLRTGAIFYDSIALLQPEFCSAEIRANHAAYMQMLAGCNLVISISQFSEDCLRQFWHNNQITPAQVKTVLLPGEFSGARLATGEPPLITDVVRVLCVSTLEPRKNHLRLLAAFELLRTLCPEIRFELHLVGNSYSGAMQITDAVNAASLRDPCIKWWGVVDDGKLRDLYIHSHFTIYPSLIEGFGLPILESIWHERPCICSDQGVMSELAREGGCLATNVKDELCLAQAMTMLATDHSFRFKLTQEAARRPLKTWEQYCEQVLACFTQFSP